MSEQRDPFRRLAELRRCKVHLETLDGVVRRGVLTRILVRPISIAGADCEWPVGLVLGQEESDAVPLDRVARIQRV
jgi:hypothetical protein